MVQTCSAHRVDLSRPLLLRPDDVGNLAQLSDTGTLAIVVSGRGLPPPGTTSGIRRNVSL